ncbi:hypothetical protein EFL25_07310 [Enterococcus faecium]|nr:predicted protein [Enterococcus faecium Com15]EGP5230263.1 hypothetical protein [Enterococcus faecium]EGP5395256.1 hypothetical protein [Enterococcus faecium]EGP5401197.1 hypothetical protein [Enterococcus faecium]EGP5442785.1 hypothetical protein [Enterococcus faecium]
MNKSITKFSKKKNSQLAYFYLIQFSKEAKRECDKNRVTFPFSNKRSSISWSSILAQQTAKYEEPLLFGCSYYLMQDSFFTTT